MYIGIKSIITSIFKDITTVILTYYDIYSTLVGL